MSGAGAFPFDPARLADLTALSREINARSSPPPLPDPVVVDDDGRALLPVPGIAGLIWATVHAGILLQWAPMPAQSGALLSLWGGPPDGDPARDSFATFVTAAGLRSFAADLVAIADAVDTPA